MNCPIKQTTNKTFLRYYIEFEIINFMQPIVKINKYHIAQISYV